MPRFWTEVEVSLMGLAQHFEDSGITRVDLQDDRVSLHTDEGLYHCVLMDEGRKFLRLSSYLPTDKARSRVEKLELIQRLNRNYFLPSFALDDDEDLTVDYAVSYERGLNIGQFMVILNRFRSLLAYIIEHDEDRHLICFDNDDASDDAGDGIDAIADANASPATDSSRPKDVLLN
jgi:hypothetical protein